MITQTAVARAVRGAIKAHKAAGLAVGEVRTHVTAESVDVTITTPQESPHLARSQIAELADGYRKRLGRASGAA